MRRGLRAALLLLLAAAACSAGVDDAFSEELLLRPLPDGHVLAHFHFRSASRGAAPAAHARGFPRAIAQLLWASNASDFAVSLSRGAWDADAWGAPPLAAPQGAALTARWRGAGAEAAAEAAWRPLAHGLGGALCASLGALAEAGAGGAPGASLLRGGGAARHAQLGREPVCTENLTPWLKGLPCGDAAGLAAALADRGAVAGARHVSMTLAARRTAHGAAVATHTLTLVLRPHAERPGALAAALGGPLTGACSAAQRSAVHVALPATLSAPPSPPPAQRRDGRNGETVWSYDLTSLREGETLDPEVPIGGDVSDGGARPLGVPRWAAPPGWRVAAHLTGRGDAHGGLVIEAYRTDSSEAVPAGGKNNVTLSVLQLLPAACRVWWHTLQLRLDGAPAPLPAALAARPRVVPHRGGKRRSHAALLDIALSLPPATRSARLAMRFSTAFLRLDELPPDSQRGVDIPPARVAIAVATSSSQRPGDDCDAEATPLLCDVLAAAPADIADAAAGGFGHAAGGSEERVFVGYSGGLLLTLPSPDASMPFNVICFVCTALALLHTGVLGAATRRAAFTARAAAADDAVAAAIKAAPPPSGLRARLRAKLLRARGS